MIILTVLMYFLFFIWGFVFYIGAQAGWKNYSIALKIVVALFPVMWIGGLLDWGTNVACGIISREGPMTCYDSQGYQHQCITLSGRCRIWKTVGGPRQSFALFVASIANQIERGHI